MVHITNLIINRWPRRYISVSMRYIRVSMAQCTKTKQNKLTTYKYFAFTNKCVFIPLAWQSTFTCT